MYSRTERGQLSQVQAHKREKGIALHARKGVELIWRAGWGCERKMRAGQGKKSEGVRVIQEHIFEQVIYSK
jgi:hypothetical protein